MQFLQSNNEWNDQLVSIYIERMGYFMGIAAEVSTNALVIDFPATRSPNLIANESCSLAFSSARRDSSLKIDAKVVSHLKNGSRNRLRFWIDHDTQLAISMLIEARGEYRISRSMREPIVVTINSGDTGVVVESVLENFSTLGLSLVARVADAELLAPNAQLSLAFRTKDDPKPYNLIGQLQYSRPKKAFRQLGVGIQPSSDAAVRDSAGRFRQYVLKCQDAILAELAMRQDENNRAG
jgi:hypothetical protein